MYDSGGVPISSFVGVGNVLSRPLLADVDGDGEMEIIVTHGGPNSYSEHESAHFVEVLISMRQKIVV